jgi:hypothetical protein
MLSPSNGCNALTTQKGENMVDEVSENSVENEVAPVETETHEEAKPQETQDNQRKEADQQERNWRAMRQRQEELEKEMRRKDEMLEKLLNAQLSPKHSEPVEEDEPEDEFATYGKAKKAASKVVQPLEKRIQELEAKLVAQKQVDLMQDLKRRYPDFEDIVNPETLSLLEEKEPELAASIAETKDPYKIGIQAYKYIKASNLVPESAKARHAREVEKKAEKNAKAIQTPTAFDKRPMAQAFKMTDEIKNALYEEMTQYARLAGSAPEMS